MRHYAKKMFLVQDSTPLKGGTAISEKRGHIFGPRKVLSLYLKRHVLLILTSFYLFPPSLECRASPCFPPQDHPLREGGREEAGIPGGKMEASFELERLH